MEPYTNREPYHYLIVSITPFRKHLYRLHWFSSAPLV